MNEQRQNGQRAKQGHGGGSGRLGLRRRLETLKEMLNGTRSVKSAVRRLSCESWQLLEQLDCHGLNLARLARLPAPIRNALIQRVVHENMRAWQAPINMPPRRLEFRKDDWLSWPVYDVRGPL